ncbi:MAG: mechanosensitive ion channel family protein [Chitinophagaceae bacterium]
MHFTREHLIEIGVAFLVALLLGMAFKLLLFPILNRWAKKTTWKSDDLLISITKKWILFWFCLGACLYCLPVLAEDIIWVNKKREIIYNILNALFIVSFTNVGAKLLAGLVEIRSAQDDSVLPSTSILVNIVKGLAYVLGFILILQNFGIAIAPLVTALGVGGLAVALALQPTLSNLFSGLQIIASGKMNIGDMIQLENGKKGVITDITWRNTVIRTPQNNLIVLPNSKMSDSIIENFFLENKEFTFPIQVSVSYQSDLQKVEAICIEIGEKVLAEQPNPVADFVPFVRYFQFGASSIDLKVFLRVQEFGDQFLVTSEFIKRLKQRFDAEGIVIPFPTSNVLLHQPPKN